VDFLLTDLPADDPLREDAEEIRRAEVDAEEVRECGHGMRPGGYVVLTVSDTGRGMDPGVLERIFEPFFTTKEEGSGLGLATVHGIVRQSGGHLVVRSEVGRGTTFQVYLPHEEGDGDEVPLPARWTAPGRGTVLLVEDEEAVRDAVRRVLERSGYTVLVMDNGEEALRLCQQCADPIDILVTDVVMPRMNGRELSERVTALRPEIRVLFMSGYTDDVISQHGVLAPGTEFIQKPFSPEALARRVGELIARG
jgi:two-component system cell cycle sensor histidine kinase/response regulator CckA